MKFIKWLSLSVLLTLSTFVQAQTPPVISNGLIGQWHLDGNATDSSSNGHNGVIVGATPTAGKFGQGYRFDGSSYIDVGSLDFSSGAYTVSGWIRTDDPGATEVWRMWISQMDQNQGGIFELAVADGRQDIGGKGPMWLIWNGGSTSLILNMTANPINLRDGQWHMYTATFAQGAQTIYIDGVAVAQSALSFPLPFNGAPVKIGGIDGFGPYHHPWIGDVDEVSIYNRALTSAEVASLTTVAPPAPTAKLTISPASSTFVKQQDYEMAVILEDAKSPIATVKVLVDGVDLTKEFIKKNHFSVGTVPNGVYVLTDSVSFKPGKHVIKVTVKLKNGDVLTKSVTYTILDSSRPSHHDNGNHYGHGKKSDNDDVSALGEIAQTSRTGVR